MWLKDRDTLVWSTKRTLGAKKWQKLQLNGATKVQVPRDQRLLVATVDRFEEIRGLY